MAEFQFRSVIQNFNEFTIEGLYEVMALRQEVFVVEQDCVYQDLDGLDEKAIHFSLIDQELNSIIAYARVFPPGTINENKAVIGRVVVRKTHRERGFGKIIMEETILYCKTHFQETDIKISAQTYLETFYTSLGFKDTGDHYLEDGIPHMAMILAVVK